MKILYSFAIFATILMLGQSCKNSGNKNSIPTDELQKVEPVVETQIHYRFPSPEEMFRFIKDGKVTYDLSMLNSTKNSSKYIDSKSMALNMGVYASDLSYITMSENSSDAEDYFMKVYGLSADLGISSAIDKSLFKRVQNNLDNVDSLMIISRESYFDILDYLVDNGKEMTLGIISVGAYVEAFYIALNSVDKYVPESKEIQKIAEQKFAFENLVYFLYRYKDQPNMEEIISYVDEINDIFNQFEKENIAASATIDNNNGLVFSGGTKLKITEEQFNILKEKITEIRGKIILE